LITKESQQAVDNMVRGYIDMLTPYEPQVTSLGEIQMEGKHCTIIVDTASDSEDLILTIIDHFDPYQPIVEDPQDLGKVTERINEIHELENNA
jgi:hypothetical protein